MRYFQVLALLTALTSGPALAAGTEDGSADEGDAVTYEAAEAEILKGAFDKALPILTALTMAEPDNADAWNLLGFSSRKLGDMDGAAAAYSKALALNPDHLGALEYQGEMFLQTNQPDLAKANLARLQTLCGTCEEAEDLAQAITAAGV